MLKYKIKIIHTIDLGLAVRITLKKSWETSFGLNVQLPISFLIWSCFIFSSLSFWMFDFSSKSICLWEGGIWNAALADLLKLASSNEFIILWVPCFSFFIYLGLDESRILREFEWNLSVKLVKSPLELICFCFSLIC